MNATRFIVFHLLIVSSLGQTIYAQAQTEAAPAQPASAQLPTSQPARGENSLHVIIDQHLKPLTGIVPVRCTDAEFLRRVSLDLIGMPPTADEARAFLSDTAGNKRELLVDRLMASPHLARHLTSTLDLMLMERRANTHVTPDDWQAWLLKSVRDNKPWNVLAREILSADGEDPAQRPAARFTLDRASEPNLLTHDISRIFFGRDMQCAQCHDHPIVADYLQSDYHGLLAYVAPGYAIVRKEGDKQVTLQAERAGNDLSFESVFVKGTQHRTGPRMPEDIAIDEPFFLPGEEYTVAPADNVKSVPKFSRREHLANAATDGSNRAFNENIANRLWAHMLGRGLVHPLDLHHPDNPATDPELLRILGEQLAAANFNIQTFLREIALTEIYQHSFDMPDTFTSIADQIAAQTSLLEDQKAVLDAAAIASSAVYSKALDVWHQAEAAMLPVSTELDAVRNAYADAKKKADESGKALADVTTQQQTKQNAATSIRESALATQRAAAALAHDKELPDVAQKLAAKADLLTTEAAALTKVIEEKTAAHAPLAEALAAAIPPIETAVQKLAPLKLAMTQAERVMLDARRQYKADSLALGALQQRLDTTRLFSTLADANRSIASAMAAIPDREMQLANSQQRVTEYKTVVAQNEASLKSATDTMTASTEAFNIAAAKHAQQFDLASSITAALGATEAALQKSGNDPALSDVVAKLKERESLAKSGAEELELSLGTAKSTVAAATQTLAAAGTAMTAATTEQTMRQQAADELNATVTALKSELATAQATQTATSKELTQRLTSDFTAASLKPLTPEQLCWSVFQVTGVYSRYWQAEVAELDKSAPLTDEQKLDAAIIAARNVELEQKTYDKLKGNIGTFVTFFGAAAGQPQGDFFATADQALFTANGGSINSWVTPAGDNVTDRVTKQTDPQIAAEELYLAVLTRMPTEEEAKDVGNYLAERTTDRNVAAQELVWALLNSAEFRFNH